MEVKEIQQLSDFPSLLALFSSNKLNVQTPTIRWTSTLLPFDEGPSLNGPPSFKKRQQLAAKQNPGHKNATMLSEILVVINEKQRSSTLNSDSGEDPIDIDQWKVLITPWCYYPGHKGGLVPRRHFILVLISSSAGQPGLWLSWERCKMTAIPLPHPEPVGSHQHTSTHTSTLRGVFSYYSEDLESMFICFEGEEQENWL